ncbi:MAG: hypothetical protein WC309_04970 [Candidatus Paceibacterota bacterium]|jgi:hypothetical protein
MHGKYILIFLLGILILLIGQSYVGQLNISRAAINLALIIGILICFFSKDDFFNLISFAYLAFIAEINSFYYGFNFLTFLIIWLIVKYAIRSISQKNILSFLFISFIGCLTYQLLFFVYSFFADNIARFFNWQSLIYNFLILVLIYFIYDFAKKKISN